MIFELILIFQNLIQTFIMRNQFPWPRSWGQVPKIFQMPPVTFFELSTSLEFFWLRTGLLNLPVEIQSKFGHLKLSCVHPLLSPLEEPNCLGNRRWMDFSMRYLWWSTNLFLKKLLKVQAIFFDRTSIYYTPGAYASLWWFSSKWTGSDPHQWSRSHPPSASHFSSGHQGSVEVYSEDLDFAAPVSWTWILRFF